MTAAKVRIPTVPIPLRPSTVPIVLLSTSTAATVPPVAVMSVRLPMQTTVSPMVPGRSTMLLSIEEPYLVPLVATVPMSMQAIR